MIEALNSEQQFLIHRHLDLMMKANETTNLTSITHHHDALVLHVEDSLSALPEISSAPEGRYADIGSGGGFPGIPLAIASGRTTTLIESVKRKADLLSQFVTHLGLNPLIQVYNNRAEELARTDPASFAVITARAVSQLNSLLELASPLLFQGGMLICFKSRVDEKELRSAYSCQEKLGIQILSIREFELPENYGKRSLIVCMKISDPLVALPRRNGMAQKRPY